MRRIPRRRFRAAASPADAQEAFARLITLIEAAYGLGAGEIMSFSRTGQITEARAVAAYLTHTVWGWSMRRTAEAFGRTHAPINRAIAAIEDARESARFDRRLSALETLIRPLMTPDISEEH